MLRSSHQSYSKKKSGLKKISLYSHESVCVVVSGLQLYLKETPALAFSCEYCKIFKNNCFEEDLQTIGSEYLSENISKRLFKSNFVQIFIYTICFRVIEFSGSRPPALISGP